MNSLPDSRQVLLDALDRFRAAAANSAWSADDRNNSGSQIDTHHAFDQSAKFQNFKSHIRDHVIECEVEWNGSGRNSLTDLWIDFSPVFADFVEAGAFVSRDVEPAAVVFRLITGNPDGSAAHGHFILIRCIGPAINKLLDWLAEFSSCDRSTIGPE